jgi:hypothetical protein
LAVRKSSAQILLQWVTMSLVQWSPTHTHTHTHTILKPHALWSVTSKVQARWNPSLRERPKKLFSRNTGLVRKLASQGTEVQGQTATSSPNPKSQWTLSSRHQLITIWAEGWVEAALLCPRLGSCSHHLKQESIYF